MIPLFLLGAFIYAVATMSRASASGSNDSRGPTPAQAMPRDSGAGVHLSNLARTIRSGGVPSPFLVDAAVTEAWENGDWQMADKLATAFSKRPLPPSTPDVETPVSNPVQKAKIAFQKQSPLDGVKDDEWNDFVTALAQEPVNFNTDRHLGIFHHSKQRLSKLGIDPDSLTDEESQYQALERDIADCQARYRKMLNERVTEEIKIDNDTHVLTASGMLGLLKSGGPKGAEKWLDAQEERSKYPQTTNVFLRTNGIF